MKKLFEYELSSVPAVISKFDGSLYKGNKAQTLKDIEIEAAASLYYDDCTNTVRGQKVKTAIFIDHMACIQKVSTRAGVNTVGDL